MRARPGGETAHDLGDEVLVLAEAVVVIVALAARQVHPAVQALGESVWRLWLRGVASWGRAGLSGSDWADGGGDGDSLRCQVALTGAIRDLRLARSYRVDSGGVDGRCCVACQGA